MELGTKIQPKHTSIYGLGQRYYPWATIGFGQLRWFGYYVIM